MSRNAAFAALLALGVSLTPPGGGVRMGRHGRRWKDYTKAQLPALWQLETDIDYSSANHGQLTKRKQQVYWAVVHNVGKDQAAIPASATADFLDAVDAKFINPKIGPQTLNGNCYAAYIDGTVRRYPGDQDGIEIIMIPIIVEFP
jgi:hypothetical protein